MTAQLRGMKESLILTCLVEKRRLVINYVIMEVNSFFLYAKKSEVFNVCEGSSIFFVVELIKKNRKTSNSRPSSFFLNFFFNGSEFAFVSKKKRTPTHNE